MAGIHVKHWIEGGRRVLRLLGTFDGDAARELLERLRGETDRDIVRELVDGCAAQAPRSLTALRPARCGLAPCGAACSLVIDVAFVREFDEVGVAALARLAECSEHQRITLRGLSAHQLRVLRYLGAGLSNVAAETEP